MVLYARQHGIKAARQVADGATFARVDRLIGAEAGIGLIYAVAGYGLLRYFETRSRTHATLERA